MTVASKQRIFLLSGLAVYASAKTVYFPYSQNVSIWSFHSNSPPNRSKKNGEHSKRTGGISLGSWTSFTIVTVPFLSGQVKSTFLTCSHKSASVFTRRINPYLTCRMTNAPSATSSRSSPTASMVSVEPLFDDQHAENPLFLPPASAPSNQKKIK